MSLHRIAIHGIQSTAKEGGTLTTSFRPFFIASKPRGLEVPTIALRQRQISQCTHLIITKP